MTATCTKCGVEKPATEFYRERQKKNGLASNCKDCKNASATPMVRS
jgi:hypothetical protein